MSSAPLPVVIYIPGLQRMNGHASPSMVPRTATKRGSVIGLSKAGLSPIQIATDLGWPVSTVRYTLKRWTTHGTAYSLPRVGRPSKFDARGEKTLLYLRAPQQSFESLGAVYGVSRATIQRIASRHGYSRCITRRVVNLKQQQVQRRKVWAADNAGQDWSRVIFTDEMSVELGKVGRQWTTRRPHEAYKQQHLQVTFRSGRKSIMVLGAMARNRKWPLVLMPTDKSITAKRYSEDILPRLAQHARELRRRIWQPALVVEDNAPIHNAAISVATRARLHLDRLSHPAASPDLNSIENIWTLVKRAVLKRFPRATNPQQLFLQVQEAWDAIPMEVVNNVVDSMEARRQAVIDSRGIQTKY
jgi:transposase